MTTARVASFGIDHGDYRVEGYRSDGDGCEFSIRGVNLRLKLGGRHQALNAAAALAAGEFAGVPLEIGGQALSEQRPRGSSWSPTRTTPARSR